MPSTWNRNSFLEVFARRTMYVSFYLSTNRCDTHDHLQHKYTECKVCNCCKCQFIDFFQCHLFARATAAVAAMAAAIIIGHTPIRFIWRIAYQIASISEMKFGHHKTNHKLNHVWNNDNNGRVGIASRFNWEEIYLATIGAAWVAHCVLHLLNGVFWKMISLFLWCYEMTTICGLFHWLFYCVVHWSEMAVHRYRADAVGQYINLDKNLAAEIHSL